MKKLLAILLALCCTTTSVLAQTAITLPIAANAVADIGNGPIKVRMVAGNASIFTSQGSSVGSTSGASTALTLTATPATPPIVGGLISGSGITSGTTISAYNGTTGITLSAAMTVAGGTAVAWGAACPSTPPSNVIQASPQADYYIMYTQARVCAVSPGGPVNTLLIDPIFYDQTSPSSGGAVASVSNSDGTLTITPTTGAIVASIALGHANIWTAPQTINTAAATRSLNVGSNFVAAQPAEFNINDNQAPADARFCYLGVNVPLQTNAGFILATCGTDSNPVNWNAASLSVFAGVFGSTGAGNSYNGEWHNYRQSSGVGGTLQSELVYCTLGGTWTPNGASGCVGEALYANTTVGGFTWGSVPAAAASGAVAANIVSIEADTQYAAGAGGNKVGIQIVDQLNNATGTSTVAAVNTAFQVICVTSSYCWDTGILFPAATGSTIFGVRTTGTLIKSAAGTFAHGVDLSAGTCSTDCFKSNGYAVDGSGNVTMNNRAVAGDIWAGTSNKFLDAASAQAALAPQNIAISGSTYAPVIANGINYEVTLVHASCPCTIANIASPPVGQSFYLTVIQSATGSDTIGTWGTSYKFSGGIKPTLSTGANAVDILPVYCRTATFCAVVFAGNFQ
jgi:hypothetical protein